MTIADPLGRAMLDFVLFGPRRLEEATNGTPWTVAEVRRRDAYYRAILEKRPA